MVTDFWMAFLAQVAVILPVFLIALTFHEFAHACTAVALGDPTPKRMGRLTLNPLAHIDLMGLLFLLLFRVGWAKPVVFNPSNFKREKLYSVLTGLAGPFANFVLAIVFLYLLKYMPLMELPSALAKSLRQMFDVSVYVNVMLGVFNLLPVPPLDGSHILYAFLPRRLRYIYFLLVHYSIFIFIVLFSMPFVRNAFIIAIYAVRSFLELVV